MYAILGIALIIVIGDAFSPKPKKIDPRVPARETIYVSEYDEYFGSKYSHFARLIKDHLHDPKSFEFVSSSHTENGDDIEVIMTYRAKNGFGAVRTNRASATLSKERKTFRNVIWELD